MAIQVNYTLTYDDYADARKASVYCLMVNAASMLIIPKRAFISDAQRQEPGAILQQGLTGPAKGFAVVQCTDAIPVAKLASASRPPLPVTEPPRV